MTSGCRSPGRARCGRVDRAAGATARTRDPDGVRRPSVASDSPYGRVNGGRTPTVPGCPACSGARVGLGATAKMLGLQSTWCQGRAVVRWSCRSLSCRASTSRGGSGFATRYRHLRSRLPCDAISAPSARSMVVAPATPTLRRSLSLRYGDANDGTASGRTIGARKVPTTGLAKAGATPKEQTRLGESPRLLQMGGRDGARGTNSRFATMTAVLRCGRAASAVRSSGRRRATRRRRSRPARVM